MFAKMADFQKKCNKVFFIRNKIKSQSKNNIHLHVHIELNFIVKDDCTTNDAELHGGQYCKLKFATV